MNRICCIACLAATAVGIVGRASGTPFSGEDAYVRVTGGLPEIRIYGDRRVYIFTNTSEAAEIVVKTRLTLEEYLVVGGGGAGGHSIGGGGGGGGVVYSNEAQVVESGGTLSVSVGAGGRQKPGATWKSGGSGGHSVLGIAGKSIVAYGGGGGGGRVFNNGVPEAAVVAGEIGSGGGAVDGSVGAVDQQWNPRQGNAGGAGASGNIGGDGGGGGGGGAGAGGGSYTSTAAGDGGEGLVFGITGVNVVYGSGGGGGTRSSKRRPGKGGTNAGSGSEGVYNETGTLVRAESGVDGTGGGGGGGGAPTSGSNSDLNSEGGDGGCGTVVLVFTEGDHRVSRFGIAEIGDCIYLGRDVTPAVTVMNSAGEVLSPETDYTVAYRDNDAPGTAVAIATGRDGTPYAGFSAIRPFTILAAAYSDDLIASSVSLGVRRIEFGRRIAYVFTNTSDVAQIVTKKSLTLEEYLAVGGGGAGGHSIGGGGGGGGVVHSNAVQLLESGSALYVSVGAGGRQKPGATWKSGGSGGHTVLDFAGQRIVAYGGGGGGGRSYNNGVPEAAVVEKEIGSGGGAVGGSVGAVDQQWNPKQGNAGGTGGAGGSKTDGGGGGGGADEGAVGGSNSSASAGNGGEGLAFDLTGETIVYGSGGGGGTRYDAHDAGKGGTNAGDGRRGLAGALDSRELVRAESGVDGTGGGGGGGGAPTDGSASDLNSEGGDGGCGTVVLVFTEGDHRVSRFDIADVGLQLYFGLAVKPSVTVKNAFGDVLSSATDYTVEYRDNDTPGTAMVIATGKAGTPYAGYSACKGFAIEEVAYSDRLLAASDATMRRQEVGRRIVYVITNTAETVILQTKRPLKLREYLVVGGGGAGGHSIGGGGGGGGVVYSNEAQVVEGGSRISVTVGAGGRQKPGAIWKSGGSGGHSVLGIADKSIVAYGGGGGGGRVFNNGVPEAAVVAGEIGSGGGAVDGSVGAVDQQWNPRQGNAGGAGASGNIGGDGGGGGGGGAGTVGGSYTAAAAGDGGEGLVFGITGANVVYGSGGGGGTRSSKRRPGKGGTNAGGGSEGVYNETGTLVRAESGVDGTGGGGGGGGAPTDGSNSDLNSEGGDGGCGTVILVFTEYVGLSLIVR